MTRPHRRVALCRTAFAMTALAACGCFGTPRATPEIEDSKALESSPLADSSGETGKPALEKPRASTNDDQRVLAAPRPTERPLETRVRYRVVPLKAEVDLREARAQAINAINDRLIALHLAYAKDFDVLGVGRAGDEVEVLLRTADAQRVSRATAFIEAPGSIEPCFFLARALHDILTRSAPPSSAGERWTLERRRVGFRDNGGGEKTAYITPEFTQVLVKVPRDFSLRSSDWASISVTDQGLAFTVTSSSREKWRAYFEPHKGDAVGFSINGVLRFIGLVDDEFLGGIFVVPAWTDTAHMDLVARVLRSSTLDARLERISR